MFRRSCVRGDAAVARATRFRLQSLAPEMSDSFPSVLKKSNGNSLREWSVAPLVSVCVSLAVVAAFFRLGTASGHDVAFHMASWLDAAGQWKEGILFPRWTEWANFGFGEPRFIFYPPLSWLFGAFLGTLIRWQSVALVFNVCTQVFAGLSMYALARRISERRFAVLLAAGCFAANPYALLIIYMRSDFAELLAIAFFPLLFLAALRVSGDLSGGEKRDWLRNAFPFAVWFCAIWLSNAPAAVIATYSVALVFAIAAWRQRSAVPLKDGAAGMVLGFGFAAFYLIPAIYEQRWVNISGALAGGLRPAENFLFAKTSDAEHDDFNRIASRLAVLLIAWVCVAAIAAWRLRSTTSDSARKTIPQVTTGVLAAGAIFLMLPISNVLWKVLPELRFVQFPWRWMSVLAVCAVVLTAASARDWMRWVWVMCVVVVLGGSGYVLVKEAWWDTEDMPALQAALKKGAGFEGTDEYDPIGDDRTDLPQQRQRAMMQSVSGDSEVYKEAKIVVERWSAEHRTVRVVASKPGRLAVELLNYPGWRVTLNGNLLLPQHPRRTEQMIVPVPAGESEIHIDFTRTIDRAAGGWISALSFLASLGALGWKRRTAQPASD